MKSVSFSIHAGEEERSLELLLSARQAKEKHGSSVRRGRGLPRHGARPSFAEKKRRQLSRRGCSFFDSPKGRAAVRQHAQGCRARKEEERGTESRLGRSSILRTEKKKKK